MDQQTVINSALGLVQAQRFSEALAVLESPGASSPVQVRDYQLLRGICLMALGQRPQAIEALNREAAAFPGNQVVSSLLAQLEPVPSSAATAAETAANFWSKNDCSASEKNFYAFPVLRQRYCKLIFGETDASRRDWCEYWTVEKFLKGRMPVADALSICCGFGLVERILSKLGVARSIVGIDIAPGAIEEARKRAQQEGLTNIAYEVTDLNQKRLPTAAFDLVWANGALHHIEQLESVIGQLHDSLRPGGMLVSVEYIGPKYQQLGDRQSELVNAMMHLLPREWRSRTPFDPYGRLFHSKTVDWFLKNDPSESIRGNEIIPILKKTFSKVEVKYFHGSLLFYALGEEFFDYYQPNNPKHKRILDALFELEDAYIESGELTSDNAHIVCWK